MDRYQRQGHREVVAHLPLRGVSQRGLGLLKELRDVVAMARKRYPELEGCSVVDVGLERQGDRVRVVLAFAAEETTGASCCASSLLG